MLFLLMSIFTTFMLYALNSTSNAWIYIGLFLVFENLLFLYRYNKTTNKIESFVKFIHSNEKIKNFILDNKSVYFNLRKDGDVVDNNGQYAILWFLNVDLFEQHYKKDLFWVNNSNLSLDEICSFRSSFIDKINSMNALPFKLDNFNLFHGLYAFYNPKPYSKRADKLRSLQRRIIERRKHDLIYGKITPVKIPDFN